MKEFKIRPAKLEDIDFLVETIIEAEKASTDILPYTTIFGLSEKDTKIYLKKMLEEEIDGCVLSISSYLVIENNHKIIAALSAWIESEEGIPSAILKGNLLNYFLPLECIQRASKLNEIVSGLHIDYLPNTIQIGAGYVTKENRGNNLLGSLISKQIEILSHNRPDITEVYDDMFGCNKPAIRTDEKLGFKKFMVKESSKKDIINYLPSNTKIVMQKTI